MSKYPSRRGFKTGGLMDYQLSTLGDSIFLSIPKYKFMGMVTHSPNKRYYASGINNLLALVDTDNDHLMFIYDIFKRVDTSNIVVSNHPLIVIRDIVSIRPNRQNDIYLLNHRSDILLKVSIDANVYKLVVSDNGKFVAAQTSDNKIRLFSVDDMREIAIWKTPKIVAIELMIDLNFNEVRMLDHQNHVYSYSFKES